MQENAIAAIDVIWTLFLFAFGACVGSFLNVVIYRLPHGQSIVWPPSHCPSCGRGIRWYDNIPILSWLVLRGRCRRCGATISPQYIAIEALTGLLVAGLYVCYFVLRVRTHGVGTGDLDLLHAWPMFVAHAALVCGLLACAVVDIKYYMVPLPVMWVVALFGLAATAADPHPFLPSASAGASGVALAAGVGLVISLLAQHWGFLLPSFLDAEEAPLPEEPPARLKQESSRRRAEKNLKARREGRGQPKKRGSVGVTAADGVNPRVEILRECLFLAPAVVLAVAAWAVLRYFPAIQNWWAGWFDPARHPLLAPRLMGAGGVLFGLLIGGAWVWLTRILGTLVAGREAMGLGDVHILAGVGAVAGWATASMAFFVAPLSGLLFVLYLFLARKQRELPYGPWLAAGTIIVMVLHDRIVNYIGPGLGELLRLMVG